MKTDLQKPKPLYKIAIRFFYEFLKYSKNHRIPWKAFSEFKPYYAYNKLLKSPAEAGLPWIAHGSFVYLENFLEPKMKVLEFGCGGSTLYFAKNGCDVVSIEDDPKWYFEMAKRISQFPGVE
jgi:hypothetical protein